MMVIRAELFIHKPCQRNANWYCIATHTWLCYICLLSCRACGWIAGIALITMAIGPGSGSRYYPPASAGNWSQSSHCCTYKAWNFLIAHSATVNLCYIFFFYYYSLLYSQPCLGRILGDWWNTFDLEKFRIIGLKKTIENKEKGLCIDLRLRQLFDLSLLGWQNLVSQKC